MSVSVLPSFLTDLFWDTDVTTLCASDLIVIERVLEYGDLDAVRWLLHTLPKKDIVSFIVTRGVKRLSPRSRNFWCEHFGVPYESGSSSKKAAGALGETSWR